ncbi:proton channel OtopLc-like [Saccoglossus kowalevskii]|uniref:Otopetrin-2-like n=1 Tax=Saccoglossus kowalevskii TaxID=10224 RepID=A0ABM0MIB4_SACKO|nr:PREDICTED: otopetrin-2-like [Saccoglossus kowalevskii]
MATSYRAINADLPDFETISLNSVDIDEYRNLIRKRAVSKEESPGGTVCGQLAGITLVVIGVALTLTFILKHGEKVAEQDNDGYFIFVYTTSICSMILLKFVFIRPRSGDEFVQRNARSHYLFVGAVLFGACAMLYCGLTVAAVYDKSYIGANTTTAVSSICRILFTLAQLLFVCEYSNVCINKYNLLARLGVICIWAGNIGTWCRLYTKETSETWITKDDTGELRCSNPDVNNTQWLDLKDSTVNNSTELTFMSILHSASALLVPAAMEYDIIMSGVMFYMYTNVGNTCVIEDIRPRVRKNRSLKNSYFGFALGILVIVSSFAICMGYIREVSKDPFEAESMYYGYVGTMYLMTVIASLAGFLRIRNSDWIYNASARNDKQLETGLLLLSSVGQLIHPIFACVAAYYSVDSYRHLHNAIVLLVKESLRIVGVFAQVTFLVETLHRSPPPGQSRAIIVRQFVLFLILSNFTLWLLTFYELQYIYVHPVQYCFYGKIAWSLIVHLSSPLEMYFRFHSVILMLEIWESF